MNTRTLKTSNENCRRIGLFGGTFDPVHMGHLIIADAVRQKKRLDIIMFILSARPPHKGADIMFTADERDAMLRLAVSDDPHFAVSDIELRRTGTSYTIDTIREMKRQFPGDREFFFILGRDNLYELNTWRQPGDIVRECGILVAERSCPDNRDVPVEFRDHVEIIDVPLIDISSTGIKERIRAGRSIRYLVPEAVERYIDPPDSR